MELKCTIGMNQRRKQCTVDEAAGLSISTLNMTNKEPKVLCNQDEEGSHSNTGILKLGMNGTKKKLIK